MRRKLGARNNERSGKQRNRRHLVIASQPALSCHRHPDLQQVTATSVVISAAPSAHVSAVSHVPSPRTSSSSRPPSPPRTQKRRARRLASSSSSSSSSSASSSSDEYHSGDSDRYSSEEEAERYTIRSIADMRVVPAKGHHLALPLYLVWWVKFPEPEWTTEQNMRNYVGTVDSDRAIQSFAVRRPDIFRRVHIEIDNSNMQAHDADTTHTRSARNNSSRNHSHHNNHSRHNDNFVMVNNNSSTVNVTQASSPAHMNSTLALSPIAQAPAPAAQPSPAPVAPVAHLTQQRTAAVELRNRLVHSSRRVRRQLSHIQHNDAPTSPVRALITFLRHRRRRHRRHRRLIIIVI